MLLQHSSVRYYHKLDDLTEDIQNVVWTDQINTSSFVPSILTSGIQLNGGQNVETISYVTNGIYPDATNATNYCCCFWASGFIKNDTVDKRVRLGLTGDISSPVFNNGIRIEKNTPSTDIDFWLVRNGIAIAKVGALPVPNDPGWHLVVADVRSEGSNQWRFRLSVDGNPWSDFGINSLSAIPQASQNKPMFYMADVSAGTKMIVDEAVFWVDNVLFTSGELSNLYETYNTYNSTMDQYGSIFGTPINSGTDLFTKGFDTLNSSSVFYTPSQKETNSISVYTYGKQLSSGSLNFNFTGGQNINDSIDMYIKADNALISNTTNMYVAGQGISGAVDLFTNGIGFYNDYANINIHGKESSQATNTFYTNGLSKTTNSVDIFMSAKKPFSGSGVFSIAGEAFSLQSFVSTVTQKPSASLIFSINGSPSGVSNLFSIANSTNLFINDSGDNIKAELIKAAFVKVDSSVLPHSVKTFNAFISVVDYKVNDNIAFFTKGVPLGSPTSLELSYNNITLYTDGRFTKSGDEGLLYNNYMIKQFEYQAFVKVFDGVITNTNFYMSGSIPVLPTISDTSFYTFGIKGKVNKSDPFYVYGKQYLSDSNTCFMFGIQGVKFGSSHLYMEVTTTGLISLSGVLYTHGF